MPTAICPECEEEIYVDADSEQGDQVSCDECGATLVVVGLDPVEVDIQEDQIDDYDDDSDDRDDY